MLVDHGMVERRLYQRHPDRYEYEDPRSRTSDPGVGVVGRPVDRPDGPLIVFTHRICGHDTIATIVCSACSQPLDREDIDFRPGPGLPDQQPGHT